MDVMGTGATTVNMFGIFSAGEIAHVDEMKRAPQWLIWTQMHPLRGQRVDQFSGNAFVPPRFFQKPKVLDCREDF